jgi:hypothetical protein
MIASSGPSVGGGEDFGLHQFHRLAAAFDVAVAGLDAEDFRGALLTLKSLTELVSHPVTPSTSLLLHGLAAADELALARLRDDELRAALGAEVSLSYLVCHGVSPD